MPEMPVQVADNNKKTIKVRNLACLHCGNKDIELEVREGIKAYHNFDNKYDANF